MRYVAIQWKLNFEHEHFLLVLLKIVMPSLLFLWNSPDEKLVIFDSSYDIDISNFGHIATHFCIFHILFRILCFLCCKGNICFHYSTQTHTHTRANIHTRAHNTHTHANTHTHTPSHTINTHTTHSQTHSQRSYFHFKFHFQIVLIFFV